MASNKGLFAPEVPPPTPDILPSSPVSKSASSRRGDGEEDCIRIFEQEMIQSRLLVNAYAIARRSLMNEIQKLKAVLTDTHNAERAMENASQSDASKLNDSFPSSSSAMRLEPIIPQPVNTPRTPSPLLSSPPFIPSRVGDIFQSNISRSFHRYEFLRRRSTRSFSLYGPPIEQLYVELVEALRVHPRPLGAALGSSQRTRGEAGMRETASAIVRDICGYCPVPGDPCTEAENVVLELIAAIPAPTPSLFEDLGDPLDPHSVDLGMYSLEVAVLREFCKRCAGDFLEIALGPIVRAIARHPARNPPASRHLLPSLSRLLQNLLRSLPSIPPGILRLAEIIRKSRGIVEKKSSLKTDVEVKKVPAILVHSSTLRLKRHTDSPQSSKNTPMKSSCKPKIWGASGDEGISATWGFVFGELIPWALRNASTLGLSRHLPISDNSRRDLMTLARLVGDLINSGPKKFEQELDDFKLDSSHHDWRADLAVFLPPMRLSLQHYLKTLSKSSETHANAMRESSPAQAKLDPPTTPIVVSKHAVMTVHRLIYNRYHQHLSSKSPQLPFRVRDVIALLGPPQESVGGRRNLLPRRQAHSFSYPHRGRSMVSSFDHIEEAHSDDSDAKEGPPPIIALLPTLSSFALPPIRLPESLERGGVPANVAAAISGIARVLSVVAGQVSNRDLEMSESLMMEGRLGESIALEAALDTLHKAIFSAKTDDSSRLAALSAADQYSTGIPRWLSKRISGVYDEWRASINASICEMANVTCRIDALITRSVRRQKIAAMKLGMIRIRKEIQDSKDSVPELLKALRKIPVMECSNKTCRPEASDAYVLDRFIYKRSSNSSSSSKSTPADKEPRPPKYPAPPSPEPLCEEDDVLLCAACKDRMEQYKIVLSEFIMKISSNANGEAWLFRDKPPKSHSLPTDSAISMISPSLPGLEERVDIKNGLPPRRDVYVSDYLIAEAAEILLRGCPKRNDRFKALLSGLQSDLKRIEKLGVIPSFDISGFEKSSASGGGSLNNESSAFRRTVSAGSESGMLRGLQLQTTRMCEGTSILEKMEAIKDAHRILKCILTSGVLGESKGSLYCPLLGVAVVQASSENLLAHLSAIRTYYPNVETTEGFLPIITAIDELTRINLYRNRARSAENQGKEERGASSVCDARLEEESKKVRNITCHG